MKKFLYILIPLALIVIFVLRLKSNKETTQNRIYTYDKEQAIEVNAEVVKYETDAEVNYFTGNFEPNKETKLSADVQGKVLQVFADVGSYVKRGDRLLKIDDALLKLQLQSVEVQIEGLEADVKRYSILAASDAIQGVQLEKAQLGLKSANVQRNTLLEQISRTVVAAPFEAIITAKMTEVGSFAAPGVPLFQLTDISSLRFTINVSENDLKLFRINEPVTVVADTYASVPLSGKISLIGIKGNLANAFPIQFLVQNTPDLKIKSGMFGKVEIKKALNKQHLIIPASAIIGSNVQPQVYLVEQGKARLQNIDVAERRKNIAVIQSGLKEGDRVITNGLINLFEGANVSIKN
ncbi:MAG: efflux RND transporter periplasmic adaptor subunit [Cyclobacteriaceae bacterium]